MSIIDDLLDVARERHFGHETSNATERELCRISRVPIEWCHGCRKGLHKYTRVPLPGAEDFELPVAEVVAVEVQPAEITPVDVTPPVIDAPTEIELLVRSLSDGVDSARDPNYCPRCTPQGWGSCRCDRASNE